MISQTGVHLQFGVKIPLRDGVRLHATLYLPDKRQQPAPALFTLTPYVAQTYHDLGVYFSARGYPFLTIDVRGRGNSEGEFKPFINEANDGFDIVEWLATQCYCDGRVAMWGGSYAGTNQWATATQCPPHLATIVPAASVYLGLDFPMLNNIFWPYLMQWLTYTFGRTLQDGIFRDHRLWSELFRRSFVSGTSFRELDTLVGNPSATFQEWISHPESDVYWDRYNPTAEQYSALAIPVLTITGSYDNAQRGALTYYKELLKNSSGEDWRRHYLVIGPWDHAGTRSPSAQISGLMLGHESCLDLRQLHLDWYGWTMRGRPKPDFLRRNVAYYVTGADRWRYADTLKEVTATYQTLYLDSDGSALHVFASGALRDNVGKGGVDTYIYDPSDTSIVEMEMLSSEPLCLRPNFPIDNPIDKRYVYAREGGQLVYQSSPFGQDTEISGSFGLSVWISIDQSDTDFSVSIYEIDPCGDSILLTSDLMRARYRESYREARLIRTTAPLRYDFTRFTFISRVVKKGCHLRLVIGPSNSIYNQKNYNSGGVVADERMCDARPVTVRVLHGESHPSVLFVPLGQPDTDGVGCGEARA